MGVASFSIKRIDSIAHNNLDCVDVFLL